ncbi:MAG TPA: hypothetical protein VN850_08705 [Candidatus Acidoferrales bacterium]|nr:hypothetical protein [Candidatus Acidoferrales bacterium]
MPGTNLFRRALGCGLLALGLTSSAHAQCQLNSPSRKIKHVVYVEFDNVHFTRDNPNVPSDLEQMPNLLNFIKQNGALDTGDHAVLISHTANDILTTQTGLYSDDDGIFISNNFGVFGPSGSGLFPSAFFYWTDLVSDITPATADNSFALTTPSGQNVPAPWVPFTRAGCDVGAFSTATIVLERAPFDVKKVFGASSTQAADPNQTDDFIGVAIHCAIGSPICTPQPQDKVVPVADLLPSEPGGYSGYQALFGLKYINNVLGVVTGYDGKDITGFSQLNFNPQPAQTLAVVEKMLKSGIPVVFAYIADAHDNHEGASLSTERTFGPGEAPYVKQLSDYNAAFGTFFANLKAAGIDQSNTLFIFTPDEGDHFSGAAPSPANCDGAKIVNGVVTPDIPCTYGVNGVGELDYDLNLAVANAGVSTPFTYHNDDAATVYVQGNPVPSSSTVRQLEKTMANLNTVNPQTGLTESLLGTGLGVELQGALVDKVGQKLLHMSSASDPNRDPTFTFFGDPNFFFTGTGSLSPIVGTGFAWNHGDIQPEIATTFIGMVGPGVRTIGVTQPTAFFTDHTDVRPTMMYLLGLNDDYQHDGRVILEMLDPNVLASTLHAHSHTLLELGQIYKQINAPFGSLAQSTLTVSTYAIESTSQGDTIYTNLENRIASWTAQRDALAAQMKQWLSQAQFSDLAINEQQAKQLISLSQTLLDQASACASSPAACAN